MAKENYIGGSTGGIPERVFQRPYIQESITGASGNKLTCYVSDSEFRLTGDVYKFRAHRFVNDENTIWFDIKTRYGSNRHPDLYAVKLAEHVIGFFDKEGSTITTIRGAWGAGSDNFTAYKDSLQALKNPSQEQQHEATKRTWTGGVLAEKLGFKISDVQDHGETIIALFTKPQLQSPKK